MRIKFSILTALLLSLFLQQAAWAAVQIQATVSDNAVFLGDRFTLTVVINDTDSDFQLNIDALKEDFNVSGPSRSSSRSYVNGKGSYETKWVVGLQAKRLGELTIPALKIGHLITEPITISVTKPSAQATKTQNNEIFIENSLDKQSAYLGQSLILTSKIYISRNTNDLDLVAPTLEGASINVYGDDQSSETIHNGVRYKIITRQYEINASKAGSFTLQSPILSGSVRKSVPVDEWRNRMVSEPINIRGASLPVKIKAKPSDYQGDWLVSEDVRLFEDTAITKQSYHVGEPITRTITLQVASINTDKLPNIDFNYPKYLRFYPDQDELKDGQANNLHYAQRTIRHAIIADQPGELTLPTVKLPWWNSVTDKQAFAVLPAQTLTILPAEKKQLETPPAQIADPIANAQETTPVIIADNSNLIIWQIICALLFLALIAVTLYHLYYRRTHANVSNKKEKMNLQLDLPYLKLQEILGKQQAALAYQALLRYAQSEFPRLKSLSQLPKKMRLDTQEKIQLALEIKALENACVKPSSTWDSTPLSLLIKKHNQQKNNNDNQDIMKINPS